MREILFRGKQTDKDKWIYGVPVKGTSADESEILIIESVFKCDEYACRGCEFTPVIPSTVGQYTGLTDKNDTKIFEGDIISIPFEEDRYPYEENVIHYENAEVYFDTERYSWYVRYSDDDLVSLWEYDDRDIIVIGNIHDNPELLKGGVQE